VQAHWALTTTHASTEQRTDVHRRTVFIECRIASVGDPLAGCLSVVESCLPDLPILVRYSVGERPALAGAERLLLLCSCCPIIILHAGVSAVGTAVPLDEGVGLASSVIMCRHYALDYLQHARPLLLDV